MDDPLDLSPWQRLALAYAPVAVRLRHEAVFAMDGLCAKVCDSTTEALLGQLRYAWWRDVMNGTSPERRSGHPFLVLTDTIAANSTDFRLAFMPLIDAWEGYIAAGDDDVSEADQQKSNQNRGIACAQARAAALAQLWSDLSGPQNDVSAEPFFQSYVLWDDIRMRRHEGDAVIAKAALAECIEDLRRWKPGRHGRMLHVIRAMILRDAVHDRWDKPLLRPAMAARMVFHGLVPIV